MRIDFARFSNTAICLKKGSSDVAGFGLYFLRDVLVPPSAGNIIRTDIGFNIGRNYFGKIHSCSSIALRFTDVDVGVIDSDHRDPMSWIFFNFSAKFVEIEKGTRFPQINFQRLLILRSEKLRNLQTEGKETEVLLVHPIFGIKDMSDKIFVNKYIPRPSLKICFGMNGTTS